MAETYTPGYSVNATSFMAKRTADCHAAFFKPYLHSGMKLLDCGCGPGSITLDFAHIVAPEIVSAVDRELSQVNVACATAVAQGIANIHFQVGTIYDLPFPDHCFDAAFAHAVLEHLQDPIAGLRELLRILKPGGVVGVRSPDWGGFLIDPYNAALDEVFTYYRLLQQRNGGDLSIGRHLRTLLREAGFIHIKASASYECYEPVNTITEYLALRIEASETLDPTVLEKWTGSSPTLLSQTLRQWSQLNDVFFAQSWCECIGFKA
jgi:SAM-dependent methyltransferase